jgi:hypothetical protein
LRCGDLGEFRGGNSNNSAGSQRRKSAVGTPTVVTDRQVEAILAEHFSVPRLASNALDHRTKSKAIPLRQKRCL